tara:strand:- start:505 stop:780 length:276 start_codon:yes stop_codon:yes gene_type:complete
MNGLLHRMTSSKLLLLEMTLHIWSGYNRLNRIGIVTDDHMNALGTHLPSCSQDMTDQWLGSKQVQYLCCTGLHSAAVAGCQNDNFKHRGSG